MGILDRNSLLREASRRLSEAQVVPPNLRGLARELSGGNQQKLVVERAIARKKPLLVCFHPTRGVDLASQRSIHQKIKEQVAMNTAVLVLSSDLSELRQLCHRILVIRSGTIVGEFSTDATDMELGVAMTGALA